MNGRLAHRVKVLHENKIIITINRFTAHCFRKQLINKRSTNQNHKIPPVDRRVPKNNLEAKCRLDANSDLEKYIRSDFVFVCWVGYD